MTIEKTSELIESLTQSYMLADADVIEAHIQDNPIVLQYLGEAWISIAQFLPLARLGLEMVVPERENQFPLVIAIHCDAYSWAEATSRFNQLKLNWWGFATNRFEPLVTISIRHPQIPASHDDWEIWEELIGRVDAPEDWSAKREGQDNG